MELDEMLKASESTRVGLDHGTYKGEPVTVSTIKLWWQGDRWETLVFYLDRHDIACEVHETLEAAQECHKASVKFYLG